MLRRSREEQSGVNLEVNERVLDSCTELMKFIQQLIQRSRELQKEIVSEGMVRHTLSYPFTQYPYQLGYMTVHVHVMYNVLQD